MRTHSADQIADLAASMREWGDARGQRADEAEAALTRGAQGPDDGSDPAAGRVVDNCRVAGD
jgi:hypothetical protein